MRRRPLLAVALLLLARPLLAEPGYFRQPALHGDTVVFVAEGDLWRAPVTGGEALRLSTHLEAEGHPAISPDGSRIAFSAAYEGPAEVYVMPLAGGLPTRLTYDGARAVVAGWTPDGRVLYRTSKYSTLPSTQLVAVDPATLAAERIPLAQAAEGVWDRPDGTLYFTRLARQGSHTKQYRGGTAQSLWRLDPGADEAVEITGDFEGTSRAPMWWDGRLVFVSDRDGTMNLWSMDAAGGDLRQHSFHAGWDVADPDLDAGRVVYQLGADLRLLDLATGEDRVIPLRIVSDFEQSREHWVESPLDYLSAAHLSPDGERLALTVRGQVFTAPVDQGRFVHVTRGLSDRHRSARWLDANTLALLSDASGETEWWRFPADGLGEPAQISTDGKVLRYDGVPSPDGKWIASTDHDQELWLIDVEGGGSELVRFSPGWNLGLPSWSPDSRWLAYAMPAPNQLLRLHLTPMDGGEEIVATSDRFDSFAPCWDPDGEWLYFLSQRNFDSLVREPWGSRAPEPYFPDQTGLYALALEEGLRFPFAPDDELQADPPVDEDEEHEDEAVELELDADGLAGRLYELPVAYGDYSDLDIARGRLFWLRRSADRPRRRDLMAMDITNADPEPVVIAEDVQSYELAAGGEHLLLRKGGNFHVLAASAGAGADLGEGRVDLSSLRFSVDPRAEWRQMFVESWRLARDYFYDRGMHGVDWDAMLDKYLPLVERVTDRAELADLQGQMAGELEALHVYIYGGDHREDDADVRVASLGARLAPAPERGGWAIEHVYRADPDLPGELGPLAQPGMAVAPGDVITAVNGVPTLSVDHPARLLRDQAGRQVRLSLSPRRGEARELIVTPLDARAERDLRYDEWELTRRERVEAAGGGALGYLHLRAMAGDDIGDWQRDFYPNIDRQGLIIDARHNGGGNIDSWILSTLMRRAWMYWSGRVGTDTWNMQLAFRGHMVVLVDEWTASDGEIFAEGFRRLGLGKIIGTRTWGGEIWLTSSNSLVDWGIVTAPEFRVYGPEGEWLIEGHGVEPDIVVDNPPHATFAGEDAQLEAAIAHLQAKIAAEPVPVPQAPPRPDMAKD